MNCQCEKAFKKFNLDTERVVEAECERIVCTSEEMKALIQKIADGLRRIRDAKQL